MYRLDIFTICKYFGRCWVCLVYLCVDVITETYFMEKELLRLVAFKNFDLILPQIFFSSIPLLI